MPPGPGCGPVVWEPSLGHLSHSRSRTVGAQRSHCVPQARPTPQQAAPGARTLQGPLDGVVEVQGGLSGEASAEVDVADARDPHRMAAAAIDLAQAQAHVTGALDPSTPAPGEPTRPARTVPRSLPPKVTLASFVPSPCTRFRYPSQNTQVISPSPSQTSPNEPKLLHVLSPVQSRRPLLCF